MAFTRHSPAATTSPRCRSSETSRGEVASSMLNRPWTMRVVSDTTATMVPMNSAGPTMHATWLAATKNHAPEAAPTNCTATMAKGASSTVRQP